MGLGSRKLRLELNLKEKRNFNLILGFLWSKRRLSLEKKKKYPSFLFFIELGIDLEFVGLSIDLILYE